jgi:FtsZ-binding cell division protein ZapB
MERHKLKLKEMCAQKKSVLDGHLIAIKEAEEKYAKCTELLNVAVEEYNSKAKGLELIPETAKNAHGKKLQCKVNDEVDTMQALLGVDVDEVMDHVKKVGDGYEREKKDEKRRARELKERADALEAECDELDQEIEVSLGTIAFICCRSLQYLF